MNMQSFYSALVTPVLRELPRRSLIVKLASAPYSLFTYAK